MKKLTTLSVLLILTFSSMSQTPYIDSVSQLLTGKKDTNEVKLYIDLSSEFIHFDPDTAIYLCKKAIELSRELDYKKGEMKSIINLGLMEANSGRMEDAKAHLFEGYGLAKKYEDYFYTADAESKIGVYYFNKSEYDSAVFYYFKALEKFEEIGIQNHLSVTYNNIGNVFIKTTEYPKAKKYLEKALEINIATKDTMRIAATCNNLGIICNSMEDYDCALGYYFKTLDIARKINHIYGLALTLNNIGEVYRNIKDYKKALEYLMESLEYKIISQDERGVVGTLRNIGLTYNELGNFRKALEYLNKAIKKGEDLGEREFLSAAYKNIADTYSKIGDFKSAYKYQLLFSKLNDTIYNEQKQEQIANMEAKYQTAKKEQEIASQKVEIYEKEKEVAKEKADNAEKESQLEQERIIKYAIGGGLFLVIILVVFIYRSLREKKKSNILLAQQNEEIRAQRDEIEAQRDEIEAQRNTVSTQKDQIEHILKEQTDSIRYAQNIQEAILPESELIRESLNNHFILYLPRDIVSGDFYWINKVGDHTIAAAADCTGHGVPGAFMSMLGISILNNIITRENILEPGKILDTLRERVIKSLKQVDTPNKSKDGMDIALCVINNKTGEIQFSGANNPVYIISNNLNYNVAVEKEGIHEIKGDKMPISIYYKMDSFNTHTFRLQKGDKIYLFSDGYPDQFGGEKGRKFTYKRFRNILSETSSQTMKQQHQMLLDQFNSWKKDSYEQVDDVLVLGIEI